MEHRQLMNCHDCGAKPGETHMPGCDTEVCSHCGTQSVIVNSGDANGNGVISLGGSQVAP